MGWTFSPMWATRKELVEERIESETYNGTTRTVFKHCLRGNVLWTVWDISYDDGRPDKRFIGCDLLQNGGADSGWGYKDMDESCGPYYYTCPLGYLKITPVNNQAWRDNVLAYAMKRSVLNWNPDMQIIEVRELIK